MQNVAKVFKKICGFIAIKLVKPEILFACIASIVGLILLFLVPPMQVPDEDTHFFQSYAISNLDFIPEKFEEGGKIHYGSELPVSVYDSAYKFKQNVAGNASVKFDTSLFNQYMGEKLEPNKTKHVNGTVYSPFVYIPQAVGISIAKLFDTSPLVMVWIGRAANLLVWILIIYLSIKIIPFGKWILVVLALNPMAVFLSASFSADVITIALAFLLFSLVFSTLIKNYKITKLKIATIIGVVSLLVLTKPTTAVLLLLIFIIPIKVFTRKWKYLLFCLGTITVAASVYLLWNLLSTDAANAISQLQRPGSGVNSGLQLSYVLSEPFNYIKTLVLNYLFVLPNYYGDAVLRSAIGVFGWLDTYIPLWVIVTYLLTLLFVILYESGRGIELTVYQKTLLGIIAVLYCIGTVTALYLFYTPVSQTIIDGVQGRYFIPISILLVGLCATSKKILDVRPRTVAIVVIGSSIVVLGMMILRIWMRYY